MTLPVRPGILEIAPYVGGEAGLPGANRVVRLASNENPLGPSAQAVAAYQALSGELHRYPDGNWSDLRRAIAEVEGLAAEQIVCGAGSDELIGLLVRAYAGPGDEVLHSAHGFLMYSLAAKASVWCCTSARLLRAFAVSFDRGPCSLIDISTTRFATFSASS